MGKMYKKSYDGAENVYQAAIKRIEYIYSIYDTVIVSFSGGKDSTAVLNLCLEVATRLNRLPLEVVFADEEVIHPPTIDYVERVRALPNVALTWYCLQFKHRNACSNKQPFWYCWDADCPEKWVRELPSFAISSHPLFQKGMSFPDFSTIVHSRKNRGNCIVLTGMRAEESLRRLRIALTKKNDNFISNDGQQTKGIPIYDWVASDVWKYVELTNCDYNRTYDLFNKTDEYNLLNIQRVCPPFGEEPLRGLYKYAECFPEMWAKMLQRVDGVATAWRYANTELYCGGEKPEGLLWKDYLKIILDTYQDNDKGTVQDAVNACINTHYNKTNEAIPEDKPHILTGCSWKYLCKNVIKGDFKGRQSQKMQQNGNREREKLGLTLEQIQQKHGK